MSAQKADVLVIGAGVAGLAAAYFLREARPHLRIVVLEARHVRFCLISAPLFVAPGCGRRSHAAYASRELVGVFALNQWAR